MPTVFPHKRLPHQAVLGAGISAARLGLGDVPQQLNQFVIMTGGIGENVLAAVFANGTGLEKLVVWEGTRPCFWEQQLRLFPNGNHILFQSHNHTAIASQLSEAAGQGRNGLVESRVEVYRTVIVHQYAWIEGKLISLSSSPNRAILVMDMAIKLKGTNGSLADGHANHAQKIKSIIKIISPIRTLHHVRRKQQMQSQSVFGVLISFVNDTFIAPIRQIIHRR